jgi:DNA-binding transcriptional MocR family regulator
MQVALRAAGNHFPKNGIRFTQPSGGYTLWISTHIPIRYEQTIMDGFRYRGILVSPGSHYHVESPVTCGFRVSIAHRNPDEIEEGIFRMGGILKKWL